jgi:hypothetical protein
LNDATNKTPTSDRPRFCGHCGGMIFRYRVVRVEKSCIVLKLKLYCGKRDCGRFEVLELSIPLTDLIQPA